jgi:hypothetical protein
MASKKSTISPKDGMAKAKQVVELLEHQFDVNALRYLGIRIWPWLRTALIFGLTDKVDRFAAVRSSIASKSAAVSANISERNERPADKIPESNRSLELPERSDLLFLFGGGRSTLLHGKSFHSQIDPFVSVADGLWSWKKIISASMPECERETFHPCTYLDLGPFYRIHHLLDRPDQSLERRTIAGWTELSRFLGRKVQPAWLDALHARTIETCRAIENLSNLYDPLLESIQPRLVLFVGQNVSSHAAALSCIKRGIPCVDIQHGAGAMTPDNLKWFGWRQVPKGGYELLPDYFWVWGESAVRQIEQSMGGAANHHQPILGGNVWLSQFRRPSAKSSRSNSSAKRILITLSYLAIEPIPPHLWEAVSSLPESWEWMIRMHPLEAGGGLDKLEAQIPRIPNVEFRNASTGLLPELLLSSDIHITQYSSTCIEAAALGIPTIFIHPKAKQFFGHLVMQPGFSVALDAQSLIRECHAQHAKPRKLIETNKQVAIRAMRKAITQGALRHL